MEEPVTAPHHPNGTKRLPTAYVWALLGTRHFREDYPHESDEKTGQPTLGTKRLTLEEQTGAGKKGRSEPARRDKRLSRN
jgi:hypothetical protein